MREILQRLRHFAYSMWSFLLDQIESPGVATKWFRRKAIFMFTLMAIFMVSLGMRYAFYVGVVRAGHFYMHADVNEPCSAATQQPKDAFAFVSQGEGDKANTAIIINAFSISCTTDDKGSRYVLMVPERLALASQQRGFAAWVHDLSGTRENLRWKQSLIPSMSWSGFMKFYCQAPRGRADGFLNFEFPCDSYAVRIFLNFIYGFFILICFALLMIIACIALLLGFDLLAMSVKSFSKTLQEYLQHPENLSRAESRSLNKCMPSDIKPVEARSKRL